MLGTKMYNQIKEIAQKIRVRLNSENNIMNMEQLIKKSISRSDSGSQAWDYIKTHVRDHIETDADIQFFKHNHEVRMLPYPNEPTKALIYSAYDSGRFIAFSWARDNNIQSMPKMFEHYVGVDEDGDKYVIIVIERLSELQNPRKPNKYVNAGQYAIAMCYERIIDNSSRRARCTSFTRFVKELRHAATNDKQKMFTSFKHITLNVQFIRELYQIIKVFHIDNDYFELRLYGPELKMRGNNIVITNPISDVCSSFRDVDIKKQSVDYSMNTMFVAKIRDNQPSMNMLNVHFDYVNSNVSYTNQPLTITKVTNLQQYLP